MFLNPAAAVGEDTYHETIRRARVSIGDRINTEIVNRLDPRFADRYLAAIKAATAGGANP